MSWETDNKIRDLENKVDNLERRSNNSSIDTGPSTFFDKIIAAIVGSIVILIPVTIISGVIYWLVINFFGIEYNSDYDENFIMLLANIDIIVSLIISFLITFSKEYDKP